MRRLALLAFVLLIVPACAPRYRREMVGTAPAQAGAPFDPAPPAAPVPGAGVDGVDGVDVVDGVDGVGGVDGVDVVDGVATSPAPAPAAPAVAPPGASTLAVAAMQRYDVSFRVRTPRAMLARVTIACPGHVEERTVGETFAAYRDRRLAEMRRAREQERRAVASVAGALLGDVDATATAQSPNAQATAGVHVDGEAVGYAAAQQVIHDDVELAPGDVGGGTVTGDFSFYAGTDGACAMTVSPPIGEDGGGVDGDFTIVHQVDLRAERAAAAAVIADGARGVRVDLTARLVAAGADPELRARERAAAALEAERAAEQARLDRLAREQLAIDARARISTASYEVRGSVVAWLGECGGDPYRRERERLAAEHRRAELERLALEAEVRLRVQREARVRIAMEVRATIWEDLVAAGADPELRDRRAAAALAEYEAALRAEEEARLSLRLAIEAREAAAFDARLAVVDWLHANGAIDRPPMPPLPDELRGDAPLAGAVWIGGAWVWQGGMWQWIPGYWDTTAAIINIGVDIMTSSGGGGSGGGSVEVRDHRTDRDSGSGGDSSGGGSVDVRDHRTDSSGSGGSGNVDVRDHRDSKPEPSRDRDERDHRKDKEADKDKGNDDDDGGKVDVRDHRRKP